MKSLALIAALCAPSLAMAQTNCAPREVVVERLTTGYGESLGLLAVNTQGGVIEFYGNTGSLSWTILVTSPNGVSCVVAAGDHFETVEFATIIPGVDG